MLKKKKILLIITGSVSSYKSLYLIRLLKAKGADIFVSSDFKYHEFFDAENEIIIADIGHFESEQFTSQRIAGILTKKFPKFALHLTEVNTNPINYF